MINFNDIIPITDSIEDIPSFKHISVLDIDPQLALACRKDMFSQRIHTSSLSLEVASFTDKNREDFEIVDKLKFFLENTENSYKTILNIDGSLYLEIFTLDKLLSGFKDNVECDNLMITSMNYTYKEIQDSFDISFNRRQHFDIKEIANLLNIELSRVETLVIQKILEYTKFLIPKREHNFPTKHYNKNYLLFKNKEIQETFLKIIVNKSVLFNISTALEDIETHILKDNILTLTSSNGNYIMYKIEEDYLVKINLDDCPPLYLSPKCLEYIVKQKDLRFLHSRPLLSKKEKIGYSCSISNSAKSCIIGDGEDVLTLSDRISNIPFQSGLLGDMTVYSLVDQIAFTRKFFSLNQVMTIHSAQLNVKNATIMHYA
tara:strand:- start:167 stop:1288 length:1122 start_codon:yes stop_codon:yes gene_type:complete